MTNMSIMDGMKRGGDGTQKKLTSKLVIEEMLSRNESKSQLSTE